MQSASDTPSSHSSSGHGRVRPSPQGTRRDGAVTRSGAAGASGLSPSARRKGDWDVPFRILSTATLRRPRRLPARSPGGTPLATSLWGQRAGTGGGMMAPVPPAVMGGATARETGKARYFPPPPPGMRSNNTITSEYYAEIRLAHHFGMVAL